MGFQINQVTVSGNLTREPEQRALPSGTSVTTIGLAHNERRKNQQSGEWEDKPHFFDVTIFGAQGEWLSRNAKKGDPVTVAGQLEQQRWQDKTSGETRSKVSIIARDVVLGQRGGGGGGGQSYGQGGGYQQGGYDGGGQQGGYGGGQGGGYNGGGEGGYGGGQPQPGGYGQAPPQREPAAAGYGQRSETPVDRTDFAPAPRGGLSDPGEDDIPF